MAKPKAGSATEPKGDASAPADAPLLERQPETAPVAATAKPETEIAAAEPAPVAAPPPAASPTSGKATYRVWEHGSLQLSGKTYRPGAELTLPADVGDAIVCLTKI